MTVAAAVCEAVAASCAPLVPRPKVISQTLTVVGPQHYAGDTFERAAGRPGKPEVDGDGHLRWWTWPRTAWQMERGDPAGFVRTEQGWSHPSVLAHRWVLGDGACLPVRAAVDHAGQSYIQSWWKHPLADLLPAPLPAQSAALRGLY